MTTAVKRSGKGRIVQYVLMFILVVAIAIFASAYLQWKKQQRQMLKQLKLRGLVYEDVVSDWKGGLFFKAARIKVADKSAVKIGRFSINQRNSLYDIVLEDVRFQNENSIPFRFAIKDINLQGVDFKDIDQGKPLNQRLPAYVLSLYNDDIESITFNDSSFVVGEQANTSEEDKEEEGAAVSGSIKKFVLSDVRSGKIGSYHYENELVRFATSFGPQTLTLDSFTARDLKLEDMTHLALFARKSEADAAIDVIGSMDIRGFGMDTGAYKDTVGYFKFSTIKIRPGRVAPADVIAKLPVLAHELDTKSENNPYLFRLLSEFLSMVNMVESFEIEQGQMQRVITDGIGSINMPLTRIKWDDFRVSYDIKDMTLDLPEFVTGKIGAFAVKDYDYGRILRRLIAWLDELAAMETISARDILTYYTSSMKMMSAIIPRFKEVNFADIDLVFFNEDADNKGDEKQSHYLRVKKANLQNRYAVDGSLPTTIDIGVDALEMPLHWLIDESDLFPADKQNFTGSMALHAHWDKEKNDIIISDSFIENNVIGRLDVSGEIGQVYPHFFVGNIVASGFSYLGMTVKEFNLTYDTKGNEDNLLAAYAAIEGKSKDEVRMDMLATMFRTASEVLVDWPERRMIETVLSDYIRAGGVLTLNVKSKNSRGLNLLSIYDAFTDPVTLLDGGDVTLKVIQ